MFVNRRMEDEEGGAPAEPARRKAAATASLNISKKNATSMKRVSSILRKKPDSLTSDDKQVLEENAELVEQFYKRRERRAVWQLRKTEQEDTREVLQAKCEQLAQAIHDAEFLVVYTGAGISTAASIPDYRGPNGIWTLLQKGLDIGHHDLSAAEPTLTHMALSALYHQGIVRHVVSQNCDGLHLRSGLPKTAMSEVHGNMYIEVCKHCVPAREYVRTFDVTERTSIYKHTTGRRCYRCGEPLIDTIVHFGERGKLRWPLNWQGACQAANACDTILCLGSSLKVLKKYSWLWQMDRPPKKRPRLYIVNLQWTPKDKDAMLKINGKCDEVMSLVMKALGYELPIYLRSSDPIFSLVTPLHPAEAATSTRPQLIPPPEDEDELNVVKIQDTVVTGYDVRWDGKAQGSGEDQQNVKAEIMDKDVKDEKYDIKSENNLDMKPLNGVYTSWNERKVCWSENLASHVIDNENNDKIDSKPNLDQVDDQVKSENCLTDDLKEECKDVKEESTWNNGEDFPCDFNELYRDITSRNKCNEVMEVPMDDEVKSEPTDSDEDFHTSDTEGEPWSGDKLGENTLEGEINFLKSSDSSCSDSDFSEHVEDCQTEDSDVNIPYPQPHKPSKMDYFKLAYASTNVQMAKQGQALLKQNDFYGTGLCIRSFVNCSKNGNRNSKMVLKTESSDTDMISEERTFKSKGESADSQRHTDNRFVDVKNNDHEDEESVSFTVRSRKKASLPVIPKVADESSSLPNDHKSPLPAVTLCSSNDDNELPLCSGECKNKFCVYPSDCSSKTINYNNHKYDVTTAPAEQNNMLYKVSVPCGSVRETQKLELRKMNESEIETTQLSSTLRVNDINDKETGNEKIFNAGSMVCHGDKCFIENNSRSTDGSFLLRTHIVDGIIRTACVETLDDGKAEFRNVPIPSHRNKHMVTLTSHTDIRGVTVTSCSDTERALISTCNKSSVCQGNVFTESHLGAVSHLSKSKNIGSKLSTQLSISESDMLKSVWHRSFCGPSRENSLSASAVMMGMRENELGKCENRPSGYIHHRVSEMIQSPEKSSSVILKNICTEAVNDSVARQKGSTKRKLKGCDNEDVKYIWFWGFDSNVESKERESGNTLTTVNHLREVDMETRDDNGCIPVGRITRSRTRASSDSRSAPENDVFRCHCNGSNPELCKIARLRPSRVKCDADVEKAREIIRKRRTYNYRKYEPVFEKKLESFTYERAKAKRKSKFESTHDKEEEEEEEEYEEQDNEMKEDEHKISDGEDCRERDEKGERKITPGWYGKGLRKGMKKKTRV